MSGVVIEARNVSKRFYLCHNRSGELKVRFLAVFHEHQRQVVEEFWALRDVSLSIRQGEAVGLIGRNGSGKSTLLRLVAGLHRPTSGSLLVDATARIGSMIELGVGFHRELNGRENVFLNASIYGLSRAETSELYPKIVAYSGLEHFVDAPLKAYSSGMCMRLAFAIAAHLNPDILLLDEILAVGDADFQSRCFETLEELRARGKTFVFVSHSPQAIRTICSRVAVLDGGRLLFDGPVDEGLDFYEQLTATPAAVVRGAGAFK